jgi:hypothetical protein
MRGVVYNVSSRSLALILLGKDAYTDCMTGADFRRPNERKRTAKSPKV